MDAMRLSIGQMARLNHVTEQTLRLYDKQGLLPPIAVDSASGYRYYHIAQSAQLDLIQTMKLYGMTLHEIQAQLHSGLTDMPSLLTKQMVRLDEHIEELQRRRRSIARRLSDMERYRSLPKDGRPFLQYIPRRSIYRYKTDRNYFDQQDSLGYELMLRELKTHFLERSMPLADFCNVGTVMRREHLLSGAFYANEVFVLPSANDGGGAQEIPASLFYCICSSFIEEETQLAHRLLMQIEADGYTINGDYYCEVIMDLTAFSGGARKLFYRIQIPVTTEPEGA